MSLERNLVLGLGCGRSFLNITGSSSSTLVLLWNCRSSRGSLDRVDLLGFALVELFIPWGKLHFSSLLSISAKLEKKQPLFALSVNHKCKTPPNPQKNQSYFEEMINPYDDPVNPRMIGFGWLTYFQFEFLFHLAHVVFVHSQGHIPATSP